MLLIITSRIQLKLDSRAVGSCTGPLDRFNTYIPHIAAVYCLYCIYCSSLMLIFYIGYNIHTTTMNIHLGLQSQHAWLIIRIMNNHCSKQCEQCYEKYSSITPYDNHQYKQCELCDAGINSRSKLSEHMMTTIKRNKVKCVITKIPSSVQLEKHTMNNY